MQSEQAKTKNYGTFKYSSVAGTIQSTLTKSQTEEIIPYLKDLEEYKSILAKKGKGYKRSQIVNIHIITTLSMGMKIEVRPESGEMLQLPRKFML